MKKFLAPLIGLALLLCGPALAGNTTLFSPTVGDVFFQGLTPTTIDNMAIGATTPAAVKATGLSFGGTAPAPTGTGTPTIVSRSTDNAGEVTAGTSATSVVITFATTKPNAPFCVVTSQTQLAAFAFTISTSAITITQTATSGNKIDYACIQN